MPATPAQLALFHTSTVRGRTCWLDPEAPTQPAIERAHSEPPAAPEPAPVVTREEILAAAAIAAEAVPPSAVPPAPARAAGHRKPRK